MAEGTLTLDVTDLSTLAITCSLLDAAKSLEFARLAMGLDSAFLMPRAPRRPISE